MKDFEYIFLRNQSVGIIGPNGCGKSTIPLKAESPEAYMDKNRHIELKDTAFYYFLNISDFRVAGEQEPYEFAQPKVKDMLVNIKRVDFMKQVKDDLYERAVKRKKIINY